MMKVIENNLIKVNKEPLVILPLKRWREIEEILKDLEDAFRFNQAISDPKNQRLVPFDKVKKKLKLP